MEKSLEEFVIDNFPAYAGNLDVGFSNTKIKEDTVDIWNYHGDDLLVTISETDFEYPGAYVLYTWHKDNRSIRSELFLHSATEKDLVREVGILLERMDKTMIID